MHVSEAFKLFNQFKNMFKFDKDSYKIFKYRVISIVLKTDMKYHSDTVSKISQLINENQDIE